ncbi:MAG: hypothetical protein LBD23_06035, partial [Oscillospiraceae bacterium]|nr:hypothetical protein [Oscillospiraceae bacterium]
KSFEEALSSEFGEAIESAISESEKNLSRLNIITTGNLNSLFAFHQHRARIVEGRSFTKEEYETGARVAVINRGLAERNNLTVGDMVSLTLFEGQHINYLDYNPEMGRMYSTWEPGGFATGLSETEPIEVEIVGIYIAAYARMIDPNAMDRHSIPINTLFIPDNTIDWINVPSSNRQNHIHSYNYGHVHHEYMLPLLNVIVVPNGRNDEFIQTIEAIIPEYSNFFRIFDQGYSIVRAALDNLIRGAILVFVLCLAGWLISAIVFFLFFIMRKKREAGLLYAMGFSRKSRFRWVFIQCLLIIIVAQAIAFSASIVLQEQILDLAFDIVAEDFSEAVVVDFVDFTDAIIAEDSGMIDFKLRSTPWAVPLGIGGATIALLLMTYALSAAIAIRGINTLRALRD